MDRDELRATQAPIKQRYRDDPGAAVITLHAEGRLGEDVTCSVQTGQALVEAGLHPATGGTGLHACSSDMLLRALAACAGVTMASVATALGLDVAGTVPRPTATLDFRGRSASTQGGVGRLHRHPPVVRPRDRRERGQACDAAPPHRAVLRGARTLAGSRSCPPW
ncbi:MAG: hypothetical protein R2726_04570 [Acidimicrobiales bacterium]